ncbi:MAG: Fe-S protein, partial [Actinomycetota bacterium]
MKLFSHRKRPVHLGPYPLERLPRLDDPTATPPGAGTRPVEGRRQGPRSAGHAYERYLYLYDQQRTGEVAEPAPIPDDPEARSNNIKGGLFFLDADMVGCGHLPDDAWLGEPSPTHRHAVVTLIAHTRTVGRDQPGDDWIDGTRQVNADLRAAELAVLTAGYIRRLGFDAVAHTPTATD